MVDIESIGVLKKDLGTIFHIVYMTLIFMIALYYMGTFLNRLLYIILYHLNEGYIGDTVTSN